MDQLKNFVVYKSSAGSGKTFTIVREYLLMVLQDPRLFRHILAVTFTNKAANEMKSRILVSLKELSDAEATESKTHRFLLPELMKESGLSKDQVRQRAAKTLSLILHNYSDFAISTIDSFTTRIVKTFAFDLKLPMSFDIELDEDKILSDTVDLLIEKVGRDDMISKVLLQYSGMKLEEEKHYRIDYDLKRFARIILKEEGVENIPRLNELSLEDFLSLRTTLRKYLKQFQNELKQLGTEGLELIHNNQLSATSFFQGKKGLYGYFNKIAEGQDDDLKPNSFVLKTIEEGKWTAQKTPDHDKQIIESIQDELVQIYTRIDNLIEKEFATYVIYRSLYREIFPLSVLNEIGRVYSSYKNDNNIIHLSEFNKLISNIIINEPVPFIYERLGERFQHFLLDEFQDTSILQWQNLLPLVENSLSQGKRSLIVGDAKQSIYRWRSGELEQFVNLPRLYKLEHIPWMKEREQSLEYNMDARELAFNFRSRKNITRFNNDFFKKIIPLIPEQYSSVYADVAQKYDFSEEGGYVSIRLIDDKQGIKETTLSEIGETVMQLQKAGRPLDHIAILCRSNTETVDIAEFLRSQNIEVISAESFLLKNAAEVGFLIAAFHVIAGLNVDISQLAMLRYLIERGIIPISFDECNSKLKDVEKPLSFADLLKTYGLDFSIKKLEVLSFYDLTEKLIRTFSLFDRNVNYILCFLDEVYKHANRKDNSLLQFLSYWEENKHKLAIGMPEGHQAVRIMTIHKAKGLEFPVVIYPFANQVVKKTKERLWFDLDSLKFKGLSTAYLPLSKSILETEYAPLMEEEEDKSFLDLINLIYVVFTRAVEELYIITKKVDKPKEYRSVPAFIQFYLSQIEDRGEDRDSYTFGEPLVYEQEEKDASSTTITFELESLISTDWHDKLVISYTAPENIEVEEPEFERNWGNALHDAMAGIRYFTDESQIDKVIKPVVADGKIGAERVSELKQIMLRIVSDAKLKSYFENQYTILNEAEIIDEKGRAYRPDRVMFKNEMAIVLDYKTGQKHESHISQIRNYANLLSELGFKQIEKILVYVNDTVEVEFI